MRLKFQEPYILQENVPQFDTSILQEVLGHLYFIDCAMCDPSAFGWPIARPRKYTILRHRVKAYLMKQPFSVFVKMMQSHMPSIEPSDPSLPKWDIFFVAGKNELMEELSWASQRPTSEWHQYHDSSTFDPSSVDVYDMTPSGPYWQALCSSEREHAEAYAQQYLGMAWSLNQNPKVTATRSTHSCFHTLIKNSGIIWWLGLTSIFDFEFRYI